MEDSTAEPSFAELKDREVAEEYLKIEENTEVLGQVVRFNRKTKRNPLKFQGPIDLRLFFHLIVQVSYLLYTCSLRKMNLFLSNEVYTMPPKRNDMGMMPPMQEPYCVYMLELEHHSLS